MAYNHKADLWSFGCVIFEICTLEKAFIGASAVTLISNILSSNLNSRWRWINRPEVHHKLLEVLTLYHLLDVNPSKRRSAKEMEVFFAHCLRVNNGNGEEISRCQYIRIARIGTSRTSQLRFSIRQIQTFQLIGLETSPCISASTLRL